MKTLVKISRGSFFYTMICFASLLLAGCATLAGSFDPQAKADQIAASSRFIKELVPAGIFTLTSYLRLENPGQALTVYIEGDGRAWLSKSKLSNDPTPFHPLTFKLASMDPSANVVYVARPCQYDRLSLQEPCGAEYWSDKRFSEEVIVSMNEAVGIFAKRAGTDKVHLVGYSGGAAVAVLIAARRNDVASLRTIAGNLDQGAVSRHHGVDPLQGSLDPLDAAERVSAIPQRHFIGAKDRIIPRIVIDSFIERAGNSRCIEVMTIEQATHSSGWQEQWPSLVKLPVGCTEE